LLGGVAVDVWVAEQWHQLAWVVGVTIVAIHGSGPGSRVCGVVVVADKIWWLLPWWWSM